MTVSSSTNKHVYIANGSSRDWTYTFKIIDTTDIEVYVTNLAGVIAKITSNFFVDTDNGKVVYPTVVSLLPLVPSGYTVTLSRAVPATQTINWQNQGAFNATILEAGLDKLTILCIQIQETLDRCVKYPIDRVTTPEEMDNFLTNVNQALGDALAAIATTAAQVAAAASSAASAAANAVIAQQCVDSIAGNGRRLTQAEIDIITPTLTMSDNGYTVYNLDINRTQQWDGYIWNTLAV